MRQLEGKHILVTGASSGMGRVFCQMIAKEGATISLIARNEERLKETLSKMDGEGHDYYVCDLTDEEQLKATIAQLKAVDGVVFCAGINDYVPLKFVKQEKLERIFQTNFYSQVILTQMLVKKKLINKNSSLVYISSLSSVLGVAGTLLYASSKAALNSAVRVIASELAPQGIRANAICPGIVRTEMLSGTNIDENTFIKQEADYPLGLGTPEDVGHAVLFHLSDGSRWLTGNCMVIDGGYSLK
jgi:NAD(P)-dependent dehydrogenase (short-subunit alcohol dehydrogenase family)